MSVRTLLMTSSIGHRYLRIARILVCHLQGDHGTGKTVNLNGFFFFPDRKNKGNFPPQKIENMFTKGIYLPTQGNVQSCKNQRICQGYGGM